MELQPDVALAISKHVLLTEAKNSNAVISPLSIHVVLSLIAAGSRGATEDQLLSFLKAKSINDLNSISTKLVSILAEGSASQEGRKPLLPFLKAKLIDHLNSISIKLVSVSAEGSSASCRDREGPKLLLANGATCHEVDFQAKAVEATAEVNKWAEKHTNGLIKEVLPPGAIECTARLVLSSALYFKGGWKQKFDASATRDHDFHLLNGSSVRVPFMTSKMNQFVAEYNGFKVLSLSYKQGEEDKPVFSMHIFLPDSQHGLPALVERAGSEPGFSSRHIPRRRELVGEFRIPRFKLSFGFDASNTLKGLGLVLPFSNEAELNEMVDSSVVGSSTLTLSSIFHKSVIEVNEEGTEAAATSVGVICSRSLPERIDFVADHPFMFLITEDLTGLVLFSGHVLEPSQQAS
ncbi:unnamed protein product [Linum trigynum]|uniref:Serpin domain-containing protein n=1 Tax=Linum trigynum TaxID=586398 RepID=A0AAV2FD35_9ROSI